MNNDLPELEQLNWEDFDPNKSRNAVIWDSEYHLEDLPARLLVNVDGNMRDAANYILGTKCMVTDWDIDMSRRMYTLHITFPNSHPRYAEGAQIRSYGLMAEMIAFRGVEVGDPDNLDEVINAALGTNLGDLGGDPTLEVYMECDIAMLWLTVHDTITDLPRIGKMEAALKRAEANLKRGLQ